MQLVPRGPRNQRGAGLGRGRQLLPLSVGQAGQTDTEELLKRCGVAEEQWRLEQ